MTIQSNGALQAALKHVRRRAHGCGDGASGEGGEDVGWGIVGEVQDGGGEEVRFSGGVAVRLGR